MKYRACVLVLPVVLVSLALAEKQPVEQAVVTYYAGPVRDLYGGSCPYHGSKFHLGMAFCYRNLVTVRKGNTYLSLEDHCADPLSFKEGQDVGFQRDVKFPRKIYLNRHVFALVRVSEGIPNGVERSMPAVRDNADSSLRGESSPDGVPSRETANPQVKALSGGTLGLLGADWEESGISGVEIRNVSEGGSAALAGLHRGNVITDLNENKVRSTQQLASVLAQMEPGSKVRIGYLIKTQLGWMPKETVAILAKMD